MRAERRLDRRRPADRGGDARADAGARPAATKGPRLRDHRGAGGDANGVEPLSIEDPLAAERDRLDADRDGRAHRLYSYVARGLYAEQVARWRAAVGDRLLVLLSDDLFRDPRQTFDRVQAFVGLDQWEPADFQVYSPHRMIDAPPVSASLQRRLQERFAAPNRALAELLGRDLSEWTAGDALADAADESADAADASDADDTPGDPRRPVTRSPLTR